MNDFVGFSLEYHSCSYCNKKFYYNGATMVGYEEALREKDKHESVCPKRFGFDENMKKVDKPMEEIEDKAILDMIKEVEDKNG